jgi:hypothetical protein
MCIKLHKLTPPIPLHMLQSFHVNIRGRNLPLLGYAEDLYVCASWASKDGNNPWREQGRKLRRMVPLATTHSGRHQQHRDSKQAWSDQ